MISIRKNLIPGFLKTMRKLVYTICLRMSGNPFDAQDLTQETFLSALEEMGGVRRGRMKKRGSAASPPTNAWIF